jgi:predicted dehydrogenase
MAERVGVVVVGIGGYGEVYLSALLDDPAGARCEIVGAVDPFPGSCSFLADLEARGVPVLPSLEEFYVTVGTADLAVVSSPIHLHAEQVCRALEGGSHVLVEKPAAAVTAEIERMIVARDAADRSVAVGFQWCFSRGILELKRDILAGRFGAPLRGHSLTLWPRTESYYRRNDWAGRRRDPEGRWILDSPASNAMAHHLHNLLFLLGPEMDRSAEARNLSARLATVNDIETFDTVACRMDVAEGAEVLFLASHTIADEETVEPRFVLEFEGGSVTFPGGREPMTARLSSGAVLTYPPPDSTPQVAKLWTSLEAVSGKCRIPCGLETARPHAAFVEALDNLAIRPQRFPERLLRMSETPGGRLRWVEGLAPAMVESYRSGVWPELPS